MTASTNDLLAQRFVPLSVDAGVLRFGEFYARRRLGSGKGSARPARAPTLTESRP